MALRGIATFAPNPQYYDNGGIRDLSLRGVQTFTGTTNANGLLIVIAKKADNSALFSQITRISAECSSLSANIYDQPIYSGFSIGADGKTVTVQMLKGANLLILGPTVRKADSAIINVTIEGILA
jgi:hypothetical protein